MSLINPTCSFVKTRASAESNSIPPEPTNHLQTQKRCERILKARSPRALRFNFINENKKKNFDSAEALLSAYASASALDCVIL